MQQPIQKSSSELGWASSPVKNAEIVRCPPVPWQLGLSLIASAVVSLIVLGWILWYCRYGLDFADEGFYLVWIADPLKYAVSTTQFGYVYHPLYILLNQSVVALRIANALLTFLLAWWVASLCLVESFGRDAMPRYARIVSAAALGTTAFMFLRLWIPTPSYNWLAFQGMLVVAAGMLLAEPQGSARTLVGWLLVGVGGWITFMAKPTTAAALAVLVIVYLVGSGKLRAGRLALAAGTAIALCAVTALVIDGSLMVFVDRLRRASEQVRLLGAGHTLTKSWRFDTFKLDYASRQTIAWTVMFVGGTAFLLSGRRFLARSLAMLLAFAAFAANLVVVLGIPEKPTEFGEFQHLMLLAIPLTMMLLALLLGKRSLSTISRRQWALGLVWLALPHTFAFGTANNYWWLGGLVGIFSVLGALMLLGPATMHRNAAGLVLPLALGAQLLTVTQVHSGIEGPYYQPQPLHADDFRVDLGRHGGKILLARTYGRYVTAAMEATRGADFVAGTPMIDLSGHSPGLLYAIGATNTAQPWIIGNYPGYTGSEGVAKLALDATRCDELGRAWLLVEPDGPVRLSSSLLKNFGADLDRDYELVGEIETAPVVGGFTAAKTQQFYKPRRNPSQAQQACEATRLSVGAGRGQALRP